MPPIKLAYIDVYIATLPIERRARSTVRRGAQQNSLADREGSSLREHNHYREFASALCVDADLRSVVTLRNLAVSLSLSRAWSGAGALFEPSNPIVCQQRAGALAWRR
jgi:hypothetical protein